MRISRFIEDKPCRIMNYCMKHRNLKRYASERLRICFFPCVSDQRWYHLINFIVMPTRVQQYGDIYSFSDVERWHRIGFSYRFSVCKRYNHSYQQVQEGGASTGIEQPSTRAFSHEKSSGENAQHKERSRHVTIGSNSVEFCS